jgi:hypothetical protein
MQCFRGFFFVKNTPVPFNLPFAELKNIRVLFCVKEKQNCQNAIRGTQIML